MFKFGFQQKDEDLNDFGGNYDNDDDIDGNADNDCMPCNDFEEIQAKPMQIHRSIMSNVIYGSMSFGAEIEVRHVRMNAEEEQLLGITGDHSELIPGVYEGGGKIWECTQDLGDYFMGSTNAGHSLYKLSSGKHVLDLGCGAGLLGILALKANAIVHFSDYVSNCDLRICLSHIQQKKIRSRSFRIPGILSTLTIENVLLNFQDTKSETLQRCKFYAGDWSKFIEATKHDTKYDLILTSETIYNANNYAKLLNVFKTKLTNDGMALVAAKTYYFGVGGGCRDFERLIKDDGSLQSEVVFVVSENVPREILKVTPVNKSI